MKNSRGTLLLARGRHEKMAEEKVLTEGRREVYKDNFAEYLLCLALDIGEGMLKNGGEVSRVEEAIERICHAYGAVHVEVFSIISMIQASVRMPDGTYSSQMRRVKQTGMNLSILEKFNALSREVCREQIPLAEFDEKIRLAKEEKPYPAWLILISVVAIATAFVFLFNGKWVDALVAAVIGAVVSVFEIFPTKYINKMAKIAISSFIISLLTAIALLLPIGANGGIIIIGSVMILVPGLAFGTAIRDLLLGDLASGSLKTLQAVLQALMIAFGYMLAVMIMGGVAI